MFQDLGKSEEYNFPFGRDAEWEKILRAFNVVIFSWILRTKCRETLFNSLLKKSLSSRPFKKPAGKAQKKFKAEAYLKYVRI